MLIVKYLFLLSLLAITGCDIGTINVTKKNPSASQESIIKENSISASTLESVEFSQKTVVNEDGLPLPKQRINSMADFKKYLQGHEYSPSLKQALEKRAAASTADERVNSIKFLEESSDQGDMEAKVLFAESLLLQNSQKNKKRALSLFEEALNDGSGSAAYALGEYYMDKDLGGEEPDKALHYMSESAKKGCLLGGVGLAKVYLLKKQYDKALGILNTYAKLNEPTSLMLLAEMYRDGIGVSQNNIDYKEYLKRAWRIGFPSAGTTIALHNKHRQFGFTGGEKKYAEIAKKAAQLGDVKAKSALCHFEFEKVLASESKRFHKAVHYCEDAYMSGVRDFVLNFTRSLFYTGQVARSKSIVVNEAKENNRMAMVELSNAFFYGSYGFDIDLDKAFYWTKKSAEAGSVTSMVRLGWLYLDSVKYDVPMLEGPDYYSCALWLSVAINILKPHHALPASDKTKDACISKWREERDKLQTSRDLLSDIELYTKKYKERNNVHLYLFEVRQGIRTKLR